MDIKKDTRIVKCDTVVEIRQNKTIVGVKQIRKALDAGRVVQVYLAANADPAITEPIQMRCMDGHIPCAWVKSMTELGQACGIEVGAAVAAVVK